MDCINLQALGDSSQSESSCSSYSNELTTFEKLQSEDSIVEKIEIEIKNRHTESVCVVLNIIKNLTVKFYISLLKER
jgi:hypothetical protein